MDIEEILQKVLTFLNVSDLDIKDAFKNKKLYVEINGQKCEVLGRIGMYNVTVDITEKNIKINDEAKLEVVPFYVDSSIRREYR